ncbi:MAG: IS110 family transposase [Lactobacillus sp.]|jgi:transposase|nr:IS110 family transposase [Lactobacillus sp.]
MECIFGIDVSSSTANVAVLIDSQVIKQFKITSDRPGYQVLEDELDSFKSPQIIFESTGIYSRSLRAFLQRQGWQYTEINPLAAKKVMDSFRNQKTDSLDAIGLAQAMSRNHFKPSYQEKPVYEELRDLERTYQQHNNDIVQAKNRLHRALQLTFPEMESLLSTRDGILYWHLIQYFPHPNLVLAYDVATLADLIRQATPKNMGQNRSLHLAERLLDLAAKSAPAKTETSHAVRATKALAQEVERLDTLKEAVIDEMAEVATDLPEIELLTTIPGLGVKTALCVVAELGDIRRFHSANAINAYIGIDLILYESGKYSAEQHIRKRGNAYARKILYKAIMNIISTARYHPSGVSRLYQRKKQSSQSKSTKKIAIAAMGTLIRTIYHLVINNESYDTSLFLDEQ